MYLRPHPAPARTLRALRCIGAAHANIPTGAFPAAIIHAMLRALRCIGAAHANIPTGVVTAATIHSITRQRGGAPHLLGICQNLLLLLLLLLSNPCKISHIFKSNISPFRR
jgi:hypothetical protein